MHRVYALLSTIALIIGIGSLALTAWLWFGDWPQQTRQIVDFERSERENAGRAPDPLIENIGARNTVSLNGAWQAVIDPMDKAQIMGMAPRADGRLDDEDLAEFSFEGGLTLEVPSDWNTQDPRLVFYQGVVWYKRNFDYQPTEGEQTYLYVGAANYAAWIYVNGKLIGMHEGGFTPFNFDISDALTPGENLLVIKVDNRMRYDDVPTPVTDWLNYGGITRDVMLVQLPQTFLRSAAVQLAPDGQHIAGSLEFDGPNPPASVDIAIPELATQFSVEVKGGRADFSIAATPERWSPDNPKLYRVEFSTDREFLFDDVGFRHVSVQGTKILLNGEPVFLRGISIHEEAIGPKGRASSVEDAEALLQAALDMGCNYVRLSHYPHNEAIIRAADRMGLMVWSEIPVYWAMAFDDPATIAQAKSQLTAMISRDRNRASVIIWSVGNETPITEARMNFFKEIIGHVREKDSSRLISAALVTGEEALTPFLLKNYLPAAFGFVRDEWSFDIDDPLGKLVDVVAVNQYFGWYYSGALGHISPLSPHRARQLILDNMQRIRFNTGLGKPVIASEFGAGALLGKHATDASKYEVFTEEYQALVYRKQLAMLDLQPDLAGMSPWVLKDFRAPLRMYQGVQDYWNRKGLIADNGEHKLAFDVMREYYLTK